MKLRIAANMQFIRVNMREKTENTHKIQTEITANRQHNTTDTTNGQLVVVEVELYIHLHGDNTSAF